MDWEKNGVNYWENKDCPEQYLRMALSGLIEFVEGVKISPIHFTPLTREKLCEKIAFYEDVSDK